MILRTSQIVNVPAWCGYLTISIVLVYVFSFGESVLFKYSIKPSIFILPIPLFALIGAYRYLKIRYRTHMVDNDRVVYRNGVFSVKTENLELYRVRDIRLNEPLIYRIFGLGTIEILSTDLSNPLLEIKAIKNSGKVFQDLLLLVEENRTRKGLTRLDDVSI